MYPFDADFMLKQTAFIDTLSTLTEVEGIVIQKPMHRCFPELDTDRFAYYQMYPYRDSFETERTFRLIPEFETDCDSKPTNFTDADSEVSRL